MATRQVHDSSEGVAAPTRGRLIAAFAALYVIWGSTYLAIAVAVRTLPPFLMGSARFLVAGSALFLWARARGAAAPTLRHWLSAATVGGLLLVGGNGAVMWAEQKGVPSGLVSLVVAALPAWMVILEAVRPGGARPTRRVIAGIVVGFAGLGLLVGPASLAGAAHIEVLPAVVLLLGSLSWALGSLYSKNAPLPSSQVLAIGMEMLAGGALLLALGLGLGEHERLSPSDLTGEAIGAVLYLAVFGSIVAYTAFIWLMKVADSARVSTYAYINPIVAVLLGWALLGEPVTGRMLLAAGIIVAAVVVITTGGAKRGGSSPAASREREASRPHGRRRLGGAREVDA